MANDEHVKRLKRGVAKWNTWRKEKQLRPDLSGADMSSANLFGADLSRASLSRADLIGANLSRADLSGTNLSGAHLNDASLSGADLSGANLSDASLSRVDLERIPLKLLHIRHEPGNCNTPGR